MDEVGGVGFVVGVFVVDVFKEFVVEGEVGYEVEVVYCFKVVDEGEDVLVVYGDFVEDGDFVVDLFIFFKVRVDIWGGC